MTGELLRASPMDDYGPDSILAAVTGTYFPDGKLPPNGRDKRYDPLLTAIHHATQAIHSLHEWIRHNNEVGPHDPKNCPVCLKRYALAHEAASFLKHRIGEGYAYSFIRCKREGCGNWFRPLGTRAYCSPACKQRAYRERRDHGG